MITRFYSSKTGGVRRGGFFGLMRMVRAGWWGDGV
jgi:hypothetical protein